MSQDIVDRHATTSLSSLHINRHYSLLHDAAAAAAGPLLSSRHSGGVTTVLLLCYFLFAVTTHHPESGNDEPGCKTALPPTEPTIPLFTSHTIHVAKERKLIASTIVVQHYYLSNEIFMGFQFNNPKFTPFAASDDFALPRNIIRTVVVQFLYRLHGKLISKRTHKSPINQTIFREQALSRHLPH